MKENEIENYFKWVVERAGGITYKFTSPNQRGVCDRIACLPNGATWFVELKRPKGGKLAPLQKYFGEEMTRLNQRYACLWSMDEIDQWMKRAL